MGDSFYAEPLGALRQGDIAFAYISQVVPLNAQLGWPGPSEECELPDYGTYDRLDGPVNEHGHPEYRVYVWPIRIVVITQGCDLDHAHQEDSRVVVAPIVGKESWDQPSLWKQCEAGTHVPGFYYLPQLDDCGAEALGLGSTDLGPAVADLSSCALVSREIVTRRRIARINSKNLVGLQDAVARAFTVRGLASTRDLASLEGRTILAMRETPLTSPGPVRLVKVHVSAIGDESEDELTVAWGMRSGTRAAGDTGVDAGGSRQAPDSAPETPR